MKIIAENKKAFFDYFIEDKFEAGLVLVGQEVKSVRAGKASLVDTYVQIKNGEAYILNMFISSYEKTAVFKQDERRTRKLLLHNLEIGKLDRKVREKGYAIIPTKLYFSGKNVKVGIALARGKKLFNKKQVLKEKDIQREQQRENK